MAQFYAVDIRGFLVTIFFVKGFSLKKESSATGSGALVMVVEE
ncbi:hypothetical protein Lepto7376_3782 [[Leptolyngbya] sp. PCC 7376]|nr:hypothetical protein [[Leptolyngbya] sp. PCC 7376]AFY39947.1 hypothetical protein Lepto7376_3782 [[Leptolyngbya] sp. PCC 7376]